MAIEQSDDTSECGTLQRTQVFKFQLSWTETGAK